MPYLHGSFSNLVLEPGLLGPPVKIEGSSADHDYDIRKGPLTTRHGPDIRIQCSGEPPLLSRPPTQASPSLMQQRGGRLVQDDINGKSHLNIRPTVFAKEYNVVKSEKHQPQLKPFSLSMPVAPPNAFLSQSSQVKVEEVCQ